MPSSRIDQEFERLAEANTALMNAIASGYDARFDYEHEGEAKCEELRVCVERLEKSEFNTLFSDSVRGIPENCPIDEKTKRYLSAANEVCMAASDYKWTHFGGGRNADELRAGKFVKTGGKYYYAGEELKKINEHPNTISYMLLERFMRAPEHFLSNKVLDGTMKGRTGTAKHRIEVLKSDLAADIEGGRELLQLSSRYTSHAEVTGYSLKVD